jgi:hypothetical protein
LGEPGISPAAIVTNADGGGGVDDAGGDGHGHGHG